MNAKQWDAYAKKYYDNIVSPLQPKVNNHLNEYLSKIKNKKTKIALDAGCGIGDFLPALSKQFKSVIAVDFSKEMLTLAKEKNSKRKNISYLQCDLRKLATKKKKADVIVAINSIFLPSYMDVRKEFKAVSKTLKKSGHFLGIFPSMESILHYFRLVYERELKKTKDAKKAMKKTKHIVDFSDYDFIKSLYVVNGEAQLFFTQTHLAEICKEVGLKNIIFEKVKYPWGKATGDFENFKGKEEIWDWFVFAKK